jgi:hypothetical protein
MYQAYKRSLFESGDGIEFDDNGKPMFYDDDDSTTTTTNGATTGDTADSYSIDDAATQRKKSALERSSIKAKLQVITGISLCRYSCLLLVTWKAILCT